MEKKDVKGERAAETISLLPLPREYMTGFGKSVASLFVLFIQIQS